MNWNDVNEILPEVPTGKFGVGVIVAVYDSVYAEISGNGWDVYSISYGMVPWSDDYAFYTYGDHEILPPGDPVKFWMYFPKPPEDAGDGPEA